MWFYTLGKILDSVSLDDRERISIQVQESHVALRLSYLVGSQHKGLDT